MIKFDKKKLRKLAYVGIIGGCGIFALTFFTISQFQKAKYKASETMRSSSQMSYNNVITKVPDALEEVNRADYPDTPEGESEYTTALQWHNLALYWQETTKGFTDISNQNAGAYKGTAIPAYIFSMATLVAFGLVLKDAEKVKEQEEKEV